MCSRWDLFSTTPTGWTPPKTTQHPHFITCFPEYFPLFSICTRLLLSLQRYSGGNRAQNQEKTQGQGLFWLVQELQSSSLVFHNCHLFMFHNCHLCVTRDKSEETMRFKIRQWVRGRAKPGVPVPVRGCSCVPPGHCTTRIPVSLTHSLLLLFPGLAECHPPQIASSFPSRQGKRPRCACAAPTRSLFPDFPGFPLKTAGEAAGDAQPCEGSGAQVTPR